MKPTEKVAAVIIVAFVAVVIAVALAPTISSQPQRTCASNIKVLMLALGAYTEDADGLLPPADRWAEALAPRHLETPGAASCPAAKPTREQMAAYDGHPRRIPVGYALLEPLGGADTRLVNVREKTPLVFDSTLFAPNAAGDVSTLDLKRHPDGAMVGFADNHAEPLKAVPDVPRKLLNTLAEAKAAAAAEDGGKCSD